MVFAMSKLVTDKWSVNGLHMNAVKVKQRAEVFAGNFLNFENNLTHETGPF